MTDCNQCTYGNQDDGAVSPTGGGKLWSKCTLPETAAKRATIALKGEAILLTAGEHGCKARVSRLGKQDAGAKQDARAEPERTEFWTDIVPPIRARVEGITPEKAGRLNELTNLLDQLEEYAEALEASIIHLDPAAPRPESTFGDGPMEETIVMMRTLPTIRAKLPVDIARELLENTQDTAEAGHWSKDDDDAETGNGRTVKFKRASVASSANGMATPTYPAPPSCATAASFAPPSVSTDTLHPSKSHQRGGGNSRPKAGSHR